MTISDTLPCEKIIVTLPVNSKWKKILWDIFKDFNNQQMVVEFDVSWNLSEPIQPIDTNVPHVLIKFEPIIMIEALRFPYLFKEKPRGQLVRKPGYHTIDSR